MGATRRWDGPDSGVRWSTALTIEDYLAEFERWLVGSPEQLAERRAELAAHLYEAQEAGELNETLVRLGSPRDAAAVFAPVTPEAAPLAPRMRSAALDLIPLAIATV